MADTSARVLEKIFVDKLARINLTPETLQNWENTRSGHRFMAYPSKKVVVYTYSTTRLPVVVDVLTCIAIKCDAFKGFASTWEKRDGTTFDVGYSPIQVAEGAFVYQPNIQNLEYSQYRQGLFNSRFSICYRTQHHPDYVELGAKLGLHFILEENIFSDRFGSI